MSFRSSFKRIIIIEVPAKTPIMRLINNVTIWPISSDWNILLNKYVNDVIAGPYNRYNIYKYFS